ncbi:hypothetical protein [Endozoicomonas sp. 8E]|uniref:hypothetical protein n=1 Tax=Endozoicomonas sp. 8E TaxID=3035692 RepID=UPI002938F14F|nr:hypothetical protein [Endozoicomonas sp. 8E]WOG30056.1 hypothetical protein P6910_10495 [Endozoicomonas sp. 8E]
MSQNPLEPGNDLTPVIPGFILVIPAKAGIHTDSPPEPYCPVPPWPCHPREDRDPPLALDSRLRGNDDLRAWERVVGVLRHPRRRVSQNPLEPGNDLTPVIPGFILVIPAKAGIHTDSPPEPYCPVPPWPCHPREDRDPPLALDSRLRGNDDLRAWERVVGVLRHPRRRVSQNPLEPGNESSGT